MSTLTFSQIILVLTSSKIVSYLVIIGTCTYSILFLLAWHGYMVTEVTLSSRNLCFTSAQDDEVYKTFINVYEDTD